MAPILEMENKEEDQKSHYDLDQLNAVWANFRLPIPIAKKGRTITNGGEAQQPSDDRGHYDEWLLQALELLRLLHTMGQQYENPRGYNEIFLKSSRERVMKSQMTLACTLLPRLERNFPLQQEEDPPPNDSNTNNANQFLDQHCHHLLQKLRHDTEATCAKFQRWLDRRHSSPSSQTVPPERDLIYDIFLAPADRDPATTKEDDQSEFMEEFSDDGAGYYDDAADGNYGKSQSSSAPVPNQRQQHHQQQSTSKHPSEAIDPIEFQKQQQELLEEELASMASRLKSSTLAMNATLQDQTRGLDDLEEVAQTNLDEVSKTTKKVEDRLTKKKGWKKKLATWSLIGTVVGMWVLCFMVMRTVPKRHIGEIHLWDKLKRGGENLPHLLGKLKKGGENMWITLEEYFFEDETYDSGRPSYYDEEWEWQEEEYRQKMRREVQEALKRREEEEQRRYQKQQEECEIRGDGSQVCSMVGEEARIQEAKARELAMERRRQRIQDNMAKAAAGEAVDAIHDDDDLESSSNDHKPDPLGCVPQTQEMHAQRNALDSLTKALAGIENSLHSAQEGSTKRRQFTNQREKLRSERDKRKVALRVEENKARSLYWADESIRIKARQYRRALGSIPLCEEGEQENVHQQQPVEDDKETDAERYARLEAARRKVEEEERWAEEDHQRKFMEKAQRLEKVQREAEEREERITAEKREEKARLEQERQDAEREREAVERERLNKEHLEQKRIAAEQRKKKEEAMAQQRQKEEEEAREMAEEKARLEAEQREKERLAAEEAAKKAELERLEQERIQEEQRKKEEEVARKLAEEKARLEAERHEKERMAAEEAAKQAELERLEKERIAAEQRKKEEEEARKLAEEKARLEAERLEQERLAAEAAKQAELERLEQERVEQERLLEEQRKKEEEEAHRLAEEQAKLEAERRENERLAAEAAKKEKAARKIAEAKANAEAEAKEAMEKSKEIAAENVDFIPSDVRFAAGRLKNDLLAHYISTSPEMADASDRSGWRPIHEAARAGNLGGVQLLLSVGCDLTSRTGRTGKGGTPLWWAIQRFGEDHHVVRLLRSHGALEDGPAT